MRGDTPEIMLGSNWLKAIREVLELPEDVWLDTAAEIRLRRDAAVTVNLSVMVTAEQMHRMTAIVDRLEKRSPDRAAAVLAAVDGRSG